MTITTKEAILHRIKIKQTAPTNYNGKTDIKILNLNNEDMSSTSMKIRRLEIYDGNDLVNPIEIARTSNRSNKNDLFVLGGHKANSEKKEICGRLRCIYKISGSRKEHVKHKGSLITVVDYKKLMKNNR